MTEKGQVLHLQKLLADRKAIKVRLYTQLSIIDTIINSDEYDYERASCEHDLFRDLHRQFQVLHGKCEVLQPDNDNTADQKLVDDQPFATRT